MNIRQTGIRNYETISASSTGKQCRGTVMIVRGKELAYPPTKAFVEQLTTQELRDKMNCYGFFTPMTSGERLIYLNEIASNHNELYLSDLKDIHVKFLSIGFFTVSGSKLTPVFTEEVVNQLVQGNPDDPEGFWPLSYVYGLFPRKAGSKAKRHTLVFRPSNWILTPETDRESIEYTGLVCYPETGTTKIETVVGQRKTIRVFQDIACIVAEQKELSKENIIDLALSLLEKEEAKNFECFLRRLSIYPPSFLKSLLQKIIRFRPATVENISAKTCLLAVFVALYTHAGAFVPDLQRFVSGKESATKRLAVSIVEDSFITSFKPLQSLLAAALLVREGIAYYPSKKTLLMWLSNALEALESTKCYCYNTHSEDVLPRCITLNRLLKAIGSFATDISMVSTIRSCTKAKDGLPETNMYLSHAVDHHCYPDLAWFTVTNKDYPKLFKDLWDNLSCINPRKNKAVKALPHLKEAQELVILAKESKPQHREIVEGVYEFLYTLSDSYLAAAVGMHEFQDCYVVMNPKDIFSFSVGKKPSRNKKEYIVSEEEFEAGIKFIRRELHDGLKVHDSALDIVYLRNDKYFVTAQKIPWDEFKHMQFSFPLHVELEKNLKNAILYTGTGVEIAADEQLTALIAEEKEIIPRLLLYLNSYKKRIIPYKIGRDGKGTEYTVSAMDSRVYRLLAKISVLYPAALEHSSQFGFTVKHSQLLDHIINLIHTKEVTQTGVWSETKEEVRVLRDHQKLALQKLQRRNIVWLAAGMGKTAIVTNHLVKLISQNEMPSYCVYTLPVSALTTVLSEFALLDIPTMEFTHSNQSLQPGVVALVPHDRLRVVIPSLRPHLNDCFVIVDELHKTLNKTQRTSVALEIATLAHSFIAMTGTLYKDNKIDNLLIWLQLVSDFEVTPKNYWVAIAGLISIRCDTKVKVFRTVVEEEFNKDEQQQYKLLVPEKLGGTSLTFNFKKAVDLSYLAITRRLVQETLTSLQKGEGVFLVAKDKPHMHLLKDMLKDWNVKLITVKEPLSLTPMDEGPDVVITTPTHCEGYDMTYFRKMITGVYFTNEATREQLERRINRLSQTAEAVEILVVHAGIVSYIHEKYEGIRNMANALKGLSRDFGLEIDNLV